MSVECIRDGECYARRNGQCVLLYSTDFGGKDCPFFCTPADRLEGRIAAAERLKAQNRIDLIEVYHKSTGAFDRQLEYDKALLNALRGELNDGLS